MGSFATFLKKSGIDVSGSDTGFYPPIGDVLKNAGVKTFQGYSADRPKELSRRPDLVVIGNVIRRDNPEARAFLVTE